MPTTVRVDEVVKDQLDRLQGLVQAETGERLTHSALLARLLRVARMHEGDLYANELRPSQTKEEIRARLARLAVRVGPTDVRELDDVLYGEHP